MSKIVWAALALGCLVLGGCETTHNPYDPDKPLDKMTHEELCSYYGLYLSNPNLTPQTRSIATAKMREKGCAK